MDMINLDDSIAALATPFGESALAVIRTAGKDCIGLLAPAFKGPSQLPSLMPGKITLGWLTDPFSGHEPVDQITAAVFRAPRSYTGQDMVELFVHGGPVSIERILELLCTLGFRPAEPGEFTMRAFLNGRMDLTRAEAVREIIEARSQAGASLALGRLGGAVENRIKDLKKLLVSYLAKAEVRLDYPEGEDGAEGEGPSAEELRPIIRGIKDLAETYRIGSIYKDGVKVAIAGRTNAGKSSLFNLFLKEDRAIVSPVPGTTRDYIESWIAIEGIPISLFDTAGLRESDDPLEREGIRRTGLVLKDADLILYLVDGSAGGREGTANEQADNPSDGADRTIMIWNKTDIATGPVPPGYLPLSTKTMEGFKELEQAVMEILRKTRGLKPDALRPSSGPVIDSIRQKRLLDRAAASLSEAEQGLILNIPLDCVAQDLGDALKALGEITGEVAAEDILQEIFSGFCVGK